MRYRQKQLDKSVEGVVESFITVKPENTEVDIRSAESSFRHGKAHANSFQFQWVHLILGQGHAQNAAGISANDLARFPKLQMPLGDDTLN